ncbi:hemolysin XhlA family protein [Paenibacillus profundus]|uniref:Hemolysin XhlA family protein n=1 Tax=Paenibacillus profundus TaxID=1173085 RepID=A0ABS8YDU9_9BACL|nr:hemolysin XhlA family protein [Paenibacillus profundus]MCE5168540.1 hemolysin XhlA family protein [Paenibacillus profundus]
MGDPQVETLQRMTRVETKIDNIEEKLDSAINARDVAIEAIQSAKAAHHRLDRIEDGQKWFRRTVVASVITIVAAAIVTAIKLS